VNFNIFSYSDVAASRSVHRTWFQKGANQHPGVSNVLSSGWVLRSLIDAATTQMQCGKRSVLHRLCIKLLGMLVLCMSFHPSAHAYDCSAPVLPLVITYSPTVKVAASLLPGDTIPGTQRSFSMSGTCRLGAISQPGGVATVQVGSAIVACTADGGSTESPAGSGIYTTNVTGVGMRLRDGSGQPITGGSSQACNDRIGTIQEGGAFSFSGTLELVRMAGTIPANAVLTTSATRWLFGVYNTGVLLNGTNSQSAMYPSGSMTLNSLACSVNFPSTVTLPSISLSALPTVGSAAGAKRFDIDLRCDSNATVGITVDAAPGYSAQSATDGLLNIQAGSGMANGVAVQILDARRLPMVMQSRVAMGSILANAAKKYEFYAQYFRLGTVQTGMVTSAMVFTFDYQ